jgi:hypothetical protein
VQPRLGALPPNLANAAVSVVMWTCALVAVLPAIFFSDRGDILFPALVLCVVAYHLFYRWVAAPAAPQALADAVEEVRI